MLQPIKTCESHVLPALNYSDTKDPMFVRDNMPCHKVNCTPKLSKREKSATAAALASSKP